MALVVVIDKVDGSWTTEYIRDNLEDEFPGWKVRWLTFITDRLSDELAKTVAMNRDWRRRDE